MSNSNNNSDSSQNKHDPGLMGLILIARFHQIPVSYDSLKHQFSPSVKEIGRETLFGDQEILLAAKSLGFRAKTLNLRPDEIDDAILPALGKDRHGEYFVLVRRATPPSSAVGRESSLLRDSDDEEQWLIHNLRTDLGPKELSRKQLLDRWDGEAIVLTPRRSPLFGRLQEFNLKWFIPYLKKYWRHFSDVLAASFFIQLFGLITPLFFQLVMDKVLTHKAWDTLNVLAAGFLIAAIFEVALNAVRDYLFAHTTTRVDVSLGAALFDKLISLPLAWFQARQAGQSVARIRELDSLRRFITSTALTLVIDLSFTFIYFFLMWFYSSALTLVVLGSIPLYVILSIFITPILKARLDRKFHFGAENQAFLVESVTGIETIKSLALEPRMRKSWENLLASYVTTSFRAQNAGQLASQAASFIQKLTTLLIIWIGAHQVMDGEMTVGQLVAFNMIAGRISGPILKLTQLWQDFQQAGISAGRHFHDTSGRHSEHSVGVRSGVQLQQSASYKRPA
jgi:subfamily B ATP-binding cassette protein HlyB/CyaB